MSHFEPSLFRQQFPLISNNQVNTKTQRPIIYFDNAATSQKPDCVFKALSDFYLNQNANVHRGSHLLSATATKQFEKAREIVQKHINAKQYNEIIWTKGATEAINLVANSWGLTQLNPADEIVISYAEHHANIVPWQMVAERTGAKLKVLPLNKFGCIDEHQLEKIIGKNTRLVCVTHISNVIGKINPLEKIIARAKMVGALTLIDGAQAVAHCDIDVQALDCDFYVFSAHKVYSSMGIGVLYGKACYLNTMPPYQLGGEMIKKVSIEKSTFNQLPFKFEAGTPDVAGAIALAQALTFLQKYKQGINAFEQQLMQYAYSQLSAIDAVNLIVDGCPNIPLFSFTLTNHHNQDVASYLDNKGIAVRSGHHCAMPLMDYLSIDGCVRVSLSAYNSFAEIDYFIKCLEEILYDKNSDEKSLTLSSTTIEEKDVFFSRHDVVKLFSSIKSWDARHRQIMLLGKELDRLAVEKRTQDNLIQGCESLAWLDAKQNEQGVFYFSADSEAKIIRGLLVIVLSAFNHKTAEQILSFDIETFFKQLNLMQHLSPSRGNGVKAIVDKIKAIAEKAS